MPTSNHYVGLEVSLKEISICVIDNADTVIWRGRTASTCEAIGASLKAHAPNAARIGFESGQLAVWLFHQRKPSVKAALRRGQDTGLVCDACHDRSYVRGYVWS
jgi:hypothetical protein